MKSSFNLFSLSFNTLRKAELLKILTVRLFQSLTFWKGSSLRLVLYFNVGIKDIYCMPASPLCCHGETGIVPPLPQNSYLLLLWLIKIHRTTYRASRHGGTACCLLGLPPATGTSFASDTLKIYLGSLDAFVQTLKKAQEDEMLNTVKEQKEEGYRGNQCMFKYRIYSAIIMAKMDKSLQ